jgi:hypothetical protein
MSAKNARNVFDKMSPGPTPYMDTKGRRIRMSSRGALFTENSNGDRNYNPVAAFIKPVSGNGTRMNIDNKNVKTVPKNIRPNKKSLDLNNYNTKIHCRACNRTFHNGIPSAQCCYNWNHEYINVPKSGVKKR